MLYNPTNSADERGLKQQIHLSERVAGRRLRHGPGTHPARTVSFSQGEERRGRKANLEWVVKDPAEPHVYAERYRGAVVWNG